MCWRIEKKIDAFYKKSVGYASVRCNNGGGEWKTYKIVSKKELAPKIQLLEVYAPEIAAKAQPGQFIILIIGEKGERIPLTICDYNRKKGTVSFAFHEVGKTTKELGSFMRR